MKDVMNLNVNELEKNDLLKKFPEVKIRHQRYKNEDITMKINKVDEGLQ